FSYNIYLIHYLLYSLDAYVYFFFFQAEDGIRVRNVTGVQTCALTIFSSTLHRLEPLSFLLYFLSCHTLENSPSAALPNTNTVSRIGRAWCREREEISVIAES